MDRADIFIETKVSISDYGYDETLHAFEKSAAKLGIDYIGVFILHQALKTDVVPAVNQIELPVPPAEGAGGLP